MEVYRGRASCSNALVRPASVGAVSSPSRRSSRWRETTRRRRRLRAEEARATTTTLAEGEGEGEGDSDGSFDHVMMADLGTADLASLVASNKYKGWLLDQFGVLHDGKDPYAHAKDLVRHLAEDLKCDLVILTNSARLWPHTVRRLEQMGFDPKWFRGVATSGDVTNRVLQLGPGAHDEELLPRDHPLWADLSLPAGEQGRNRRCLHLLWREHDKENGIDLEALGIDVTEDPHMADFVLVHWFDSLALEDGTLRPVSREEISAMLAECAKRELPMLVANPDIVAHKGDKLLPMPGSLAVEYAELGCPAEKIHLLGKPSPVVYNLAKTKFLSHLSKEEIIAVGDSLEHDIQGACGWRVDSAFITTGIHCDDLQGEECLIPEDAWCDPQELERLCREHNADPTICAEVFGLYDSRDER